MSKKKVDRRIRRTKQLLKDALISLMNEKEFATISITDIINRSELNRSTFYSHYREKEELLTCIVDELIEEMFKKMQEPSHQKLTAVNDPDCPSYATIQLFSYVAENAVYFKTMLNNHRVPLFAQKLSDTLYKYYLKEIES